MRIRRLSLLAFGPFSGAVLDFGETRGGLDVVYGPNEAGKSTTLRGISGLLFGIPEKTTDAHRHAMNELRIGGLIEDGTGRTIEVVRRKGRKNTLLDVSGQPLDPAILAPALAGTTGDLFETMFGLDHERLRRSAEDLLKGKGHVGESLFSAGAGAHDIRALRERLAAEAERLFTARGRDQKTLTRLIVEVREAREAVELRSTGARAYLEQEGLLDELRRTSEALSTERMRLLAEQARLQRLSNVLPDLARDEQIGKELEALGDVVRLAPDSAERRRSAVRELTEAERSREQVSQEMSRLYARLRALGEPLPIESLDEDVIRDLEDRRGRHVAAGKDLPKREGSLAERLEAVRKALSSVDPTLTLADVDRLRVGASRAARIRKLAQERRDRDAELAHLRRELESLDQKRAQAMARLWPGREAGPGARLDRSSVPTTQVVDAIARQWAALDSRREAILVDRERLRKRRVTIEQELDRLRKLGHVPTEAELARARSERDALIAAAARQTVSATPAAASETLWSAVRGADDLADRLRREAERVYEFAALTSELEASEKEDRNLAVKSGEEDAELRILEGKWQALWSNAELVPGRPEEMRPFSERFAHLVDIEVEREGVAAHVDRKAREMERWAAEWRTAIEPLPLSPDASTEEATAVIEATSELLSQTEKAEELRRRIQGMQRDSARFAEDTEALCRSFLPEALGSSHAEAAERLSAAFRKARSDAEERSRLSREIEGHRATLSKLEPHEQSARDRVAGLLREARVSDLGALEDAERRSERARSLEAEREATRRKILDLGEGTSLDVLAAETRDFDVDAARARRREIAEEIERVDAERQRIVARIATIEAGIPKLREGAIDEAAVLADRVARLKREGQRYLRVKLSSILLDREIEKYRQANQGPILARAAELLPRLTLGNYTGLRVGFDGDEDTPVLQCVRQDGVSVNVEGLSEGTRYQLYLALRLSSLERYVEHSEPMPLVLDDVLIHSDDDRARAALAVLADVSRFTQVVFFTHHARLVDLARAAVDPGSLRVHALPSAD